MADKFTKVERSLIMKAVKSKGNKSTELKLISIFKENGITGWRRNMDILGKPDFVFKRKRVALFADGCFWHGHSCKKVWPKRNAKYWEEKIQSNILRDRQITKDLKKKGWIVLRVWECKLKTYTLSPKMKTLLKP